MAAGPAGLRHARRSLRIVSASFTHQPCDVIKLPTPCGVSKSAAHFTMISINNNLISFCSYGISVGLGHIPAFLPYISDAGVLAPGQQLRL